MNKREELLTQTANSQLGPSRQHNSIVFTPWTQSEHKRLIDVLNLFSQQRGDSDPETVSLGPSAWHKARLTMKTDRTLVELMLHTTVDEERRKGGPLRESRTGGKAGPGWSEEQQSKLEKGLAQFPEVEFPGAQRYLQLALHVFPGDWTVREIAARVQATTKQAVNHERPAAAPVAKTSLPAIVMPSTEEILAQARAAAKGQQVTKPQQIIPTGRVANEDPPSQPCAKKPRSSAPASL